MASPLATTIWPVLGLRVTTPRLELRTIDEELGAELAELAAGGIHDPATMPFAMAWSDVPPPQLQRNTLQYYWRTLAEWTPVAWTCQFATIVDGLVVGTTALFAKDFGVLRTFETGSWLGKAHQGRGIGAEMRVATLQLGFAGLVALTATTGAFVDNPRSLGVTRKLGYREVEPEAKVRRGERGIVRKFVMDREHWEAHVRRDDITIAGLDPCLELFGV